MKSFQVSKFFFFSTCVFALLSYALYKPLPPGFCKSTLDRTIMHVMEPGLRLTYYWPRGLFPSKTTGMVWWPRLILNNLSKLIGPLWPTSRSLHIDTLEWEGVKVRVYNPRNASTDGAVIFIHGGGFSIGSIDMYDSITRQIATLLNSVLVSIDYRLSPETPFPGGLQDSEKVIDYFMDIAAERNQVVIMGDSAGGNLAAAITQRRKINHATPELAGQVLIYPLLQMADFQSTSYRFYRKHLDGFSFVDPDTVVFYYMTYTGIDMDKFGHLAKKNVHTNGHVAPEHQHIIKTVLRYEEFSNIHSYPGVSLPETAKVEENAELQEMLAPWITNPDFSPIMREDLSGLPRALILTCEFDVLRDEGIMYGRRLQEAGVPTTIRNYENGFHEMLNFHHEIEEGATLLRDIVQLTYDLIKST